MNPGYFQSNYFPELYWQEDYWPDFGGLTTAALHIFSTTTVEPVHISDSGNNVLIAGDLELQNVYVEDTAIFGPSGISYNTIHDELQISSGTALDLSATNNITMDCVEVVIEADATIEGTLETEAGRIKFPSRYTTTQTLDETDYEVFCNTDGSAWTVSLPAGIHGTTYRIINTGTSGNLLTITPNGSENLIGVNSNYFRKDGETLIITYNATDGWY
jgi:hypothetical protein